MKKIKSFQKNKKFLCEITKIPMNLGLVGVTEGRVPVASPLYSYSKSATTRRSGRVTGVWAGTKRGEEGEGALKKI